MFEAKFQTFEDRAAGGSSAEDDRLEPRQVSGGQFDCSSAAVSDA
jgi:hypothetical protein